MSQAGGGGAFRGGALTTTIKGWPTTREGWNYVPVSARASPAPQSASKQAPIRASASPSIGALAAAGDRAE